MSEFAGFKQGTLESELYLFLRVWHPLATVYVQLASVDHYKVFLFGGPRNFFPGSHSEVEVLIGCQQFERL